MLLQVASNTIGVVSISHKQVINKSIGITLLNDFVWNLLIEVNSQGKRKFSNCSNKI